MISLMLCQVRHSVAGSCASACQKLLIQSVLRVAIMSSYMARTSALASSSLTSPKVAMPPPTGKSNTLSGTICVMRKIIPLVLMLAPVAAAIEQNDVEFAKPGGVSMTLDLRVPEGKGPFPTAIIVHGGG